MSKEYLGVLPEGWRLERLNNVANLCGRIGWQGLTANEYQNEGPWLVTGTDFQNGKINWSSCVHISEKRWEEAWQIKLQPNDLLITKDGTVGKLAIVEDMPGKASLNSGVMRIVPLNYDDYSVKYLYYILQTDVFTEWFKDVNAGASTIQHLFQKDFEHFVFPLPPLTEQNAIAMRLDEICGRLDRAVINLETQLKTLERYRASIIHEAVTCGLDPDVTAKPSGVDWIGDIPESWSVTKVKYLATGTEGIFKDGDWIESDVIVESGIRYLTSGNVGPGHFKRQGNGYITEQTKQKLNCLIVRPGDVLISRLNLPMGRACIVPDDEPEYVVAVDNVVLRGDCFEPRYIVYAMNEKGYSEQLAMTARGATMARLSRTLLGNQYIWLPPISEQEQIADYLDARTAAIDAVLDTKRKQLDILKRRRKSLIYEYVTGMRRVIEEA